MDNRGRHKPFSQLALASGLALLAGCNGGLVEGEGGERLGAGSDSCSSDCAGRVCGDDGCGGSCGDCTEGNLCNGLGTCYDPNDCTPDCADRVCGDDGCGGECAPNNCAANQTCNIAGQCVADLVPPGEPFAGASDGLFLDGFFPIGEWILYPGDVQTRIARGINTAVTIGEHAEYSDQEWDDIMAAAGLKVIRKPIGDLTTDAAKPHLLAWAHRDEPNMGTGTAPYFDETLVYNTIPNDAAAWRAAAPDQPIFLQMAGFDMSASGPYGCHGPGAIPPTQTPPEGRLDCIPTLFSAADWISNDFYPVGFSALNEFGEETRQNGWVLDKLQGLPNGFDPNWSNNWAGGKPLFAFIENNFFDSTGASRIVTPAEMRAQIWGVIIHGARGITYFSVRVGPPGFLWDNVPPDLEAEMILQNAKVTALSNVLQDVINPSSVSATMSAAQLEAGWRDTPSGKFFFVLNTLATPVNGATITLTGIGAATSATVYRESRTEEIVGGNITDDFGEFELHIYRVTP